MRDGIAAQASARALWVGTFLAMGLIACGSDGDESAGGGAGVDAGMGGGNGNGSSSGGGGGSSGGGETALDGSVPSGDSGVEASAGRDGGSDPVAMADGMITPEEGGIAVSDDGLVVLEVPPGAVDEDVEVTIRLLDDDEAPSDLVDGDGMPRAVYDLQPEGLTFSEPATVTYTLSDDELDELDFGQPLPAQALWLRTDGDDELLDNVRTRFDFDSESVEVVADVPHFSSIWRSRHLFTTTLTPRRIVTEAPARWNAYLTVTSVRPPEDVAESFSFAGIDEAPAFEIGQRGYSALGVVDLLNSGVTALGGIFDSGSDLRGYTAPPADPNRGSGGSYRVEPTGYFGCEEAGTGVYEVVVEVTVTSKSPVTGEETRHSMAVLSVGHATCREAEPPREGLVVTPVTGLESVRRSDAIDAGPVPFIFVAGENGYAGVNTQGEVVYDRTTDDNPGIYGALGLVVPSPDGAPITGVTVFGNGVWAFDPFSPLSGQFNAFSQLLDPFGTSNHTDATTIPNPDGAGSSLGAWVTNFTLHSIERFAHNGDPMFPGLQVDEEGELAGPLGSSGNVVSAVQHGGHLLAATEGDTDTPGELWLIAVPPDAWTKVGDIGDTASSSVGLECSGDRCFASVSGEGEIAMLGPDSSGGLQIDDVLMTGQGVLDIDVLSSGGTTRVLSTGRLDHTVHVHEVDADGTVTHFSASTNGTCDGPVGAAFVGDGSTFALGCADPDGQLLFMHQDDLTEQ